jgi:dihydrofolate synthase/folylpolyglutamate synthase
MTYQESLNWLFSQVPNYQNIGNQAYKPGLQNIEKLMDLYGNPHTQFKSIHIAGTNGKGSTSHALASILQEAGYEVGLFTSPHLKNFTERIRINGKECSESFIHENILKIKNSILDNYSFFELTTAFAFEYFAKNKVDIAIIEVGLGGRLDSTNIITPEICGIVSISFDHQDLLGNSLEEIATEKAGIIKQKIPVVIGEEKPNLVSLFKNIANQKEAKMIIPDFDFRPSDLKGFCQVQNQKVVLGIIDELINKGWKISENNISEGLLNIVKNTKLRGRWEILQQNPLIICDTGHNQAGIQQIIQQLQVQNKDVLMVLGFVKGKNIDEILTLLPKNYTYIFTKPTIFRGISPYEYENLIKNHQLNYKIIEQIDEAYLFVNKEVNYDKLIFIGGSTFVVSDILGKFY